MDAKNFIKILSKLIDKRIEAKVNMLVESKIKQILEQTKKNSKKQDSNVLDDLLNEAKKTLPNITENKNKPVVNVSYDDDEISSINSVKSVVDYKNLPDHLKKVFNKDYSNQI